MKVIMILPSLAGGGAERVTLELARQFSLLGHEVEFLVVNEVGELLQEVRRNYPVTFLNTNKKLLLINKLVRYINEKCPDYVIASMWGLTVYTAFSKLFFKYNVKLMLIEHSSLRNQFKNSRFVIRAWLRISTFIGYRIADYLVGVSEGVSGDMQHVSMMSKKPITIHNPVALQNNNFKARKANKEYVIVSAGRLIDAKDYPTLLKAFSLLRKKVNAKLIILGDGPLLNELILLTSELGIKENVIFKGFVDDPREYYREADLFVLASKREGFSLVIVEAMGCGTPVVSTDCNYGPAEILCNGEFGMLVEVKDYRGLSEAMHKSLLSEHDACKLIKRAKDFLPEKIAQKYLSVLSGKDGSGL